MNVVAVVLAGGAGERLSVLSDHRAKPAVPFGGKYRIIDFALSNCVNSGIDRVLVLTQYSPRSLIDHIGVGGPGTSTAPSAAASGSSSRTSPGPTRWAGTPAPPTPSDGTATSIAEENPTSCSSWRGTTSTRWTTGRSSRRTWARGDLTVAVLTVPPTRHPGWGSA